MSSDRLVARTLSVMRAKVPLEKTRGGWAGYSQVPAKACCPGVQADRLLLPPRKKKDDIFHRLLFMIPGRPFHDLVCVQSEPISLAIHLFNYSHLPL